MDSAHEIEAEELLLGHRVFQQLQVAPQARSPPALFKVFIQLQGAAWLVLASDRVSLHSQYPVFIRRELVLEESGHGRSVGLILHPGGPVLGCKVWMMMIMVMLVSVMIVATPSCTLRMMMV